MKLEIQLDDKIVEQIKKEGYVFTGEFREAKEGEHYYNSVYSTSVPHGLQTGTSGKYLILKPKPVPIKINSIALPNGWWVTAVRDGNGIIQISEKKPELGIDLNGRLAWKTNDHGYVLPGNYCCFDGVPFEDCIFQVERDESWT